KIVSWGKDNCKPKEICRRILNALEGKAVVATSDLKDTRDAEEIFKRMKLYFSKYAMYGNVIYEFQQYKDESLADFAIRLRLAAMECELKNPQLILVLFVNGIRSEELKSYLKTADCTDITDALEKAQKFVAMQPKSKSWKSR